MIPVEASFLRAAQGRAAQPRAAVVLQNGFGQYLFSDRRPTDPMLGLAGPVLADGSHLADGTAPLTGSELMGWGARVTGWGQARESIQARQGGVLASMGQVETPTFTVDLDNGDELMSRLQAREGLLGAAISLKLGFDGLDMRDFVTRFTGTVRRVTLSRTGCTLEAEGR